MAKKSSKDRSRVILAADAGSYSVTSVDLAVAMAASAGSLLQGLFVEDEDLLRIIGLPCAREITLTTATKRSTSSEQMQRSLRLVASEFQQTLQRQAQALQVAWRFDTARGRIRDIGLKSTSDATYTILAHQLPHRLQSRQQRVSRKILLLGDTSAELKRVLKMLIGRFFLVDQSTNGTFIHNVQGEETFVRRDSIELTRVRSEGDERLALPRWLGRYGNRITQVELSLAELLARLGQPGTAFDFAILSKVGRDEDKALLVDALRCPIILIP